MIPRLLLALFLLGPHLALASEGGTTVVPLYEDEADPPPPPPPTPADGGGLPFQEGTLGLSFTLGGIGMNHWGGSTFGLQLQQLPTVGVTWFIDPANALRVDLGLVMSVRPDFDLDLEVGFGYRMYFAGMSGRIAPYAQPGVVVGWIGESIHIGLVGLVGVEYFFNDQLALGGNLGLRLLLLRDLDRISFVTGTSGLHLSFYW